jgi:hypothetical protein
MTPQTDDPADMADDAANEELARHFGWTNFKLEHGHYEDFWVGQPPDVPYLSVVPNYCSPDAPHSLRVALVEAVHDATTEREFARFIANLIKSHRIAGGEAPMAVTKDTDLFCAVFNGLTVAQPILARCALTALRAAGSGKESQEGNES